MLMISRDYASPLKSIYNILKIQILKRCMQGEGDVRATSQASSMSNMGAGGWGSFAEMGKTVRSRFWGEIN